MEELFKEKSWSVKLVDGFVLDNEVRSPFCAECQNTCSLLLHNGSDPNVVLFGCTNSKCQHRLIRLRFPQQ